MWHILLLSKARHLLGKVIFVSNIQQIKVQRILQGPKIAMLKHHFV